MNSPAKPADLDEELASKWIDDPKTEAEAGWNAMILLYRDTYRESERARAIWEANDDSIAYIAYDAYGKTAISLAEILGIFEDEPQ